MIATMIDPMMPGPGLETRVVSREDDVREEATDDGADDPEQIVLAMLMESSAGDDGAGHEATMNR
jgi:hypothetical protein